MNMKAIQDVSMAKQQKGFKLADPGVYMGYIEEAEPATASTGNGMVKCKIKLTDENGASAGNLWTNIMFYDGMPSFCMQQVKAWCLACGISMEGDLPVESFATGLDRKEISIRVTQEEKEGYKPRLIVDWDDLNAGVAPIEQFDQWNEVYNHDVPVTDFVNDFGGEDGEF